MKRHILARRDYIRIKCLKEIKYSYSLHKKCKVDILNISETGAMLRILQCFKEGDIIYLHFDEGCIISSEVRYSNSNIIGVRFIDLDDTLIKFIKSLIKELK